MGKRRVLLFTLTIGLLALEPSVQMAVAAGPPTPRSVSPAPPTPAPPQKTAKPAVTKPALPDADVERAIRARFAKSKIAVNGFTVRVEGGAAIIEGKTGVIQHKGTATRLAKLAGARRVDNRIQISEAAREKAAAHLASGKKVHVQTGKE